MNRFRFFLKLQEKIHCSVLVMVSCIPLCMALTFFYQSKERLDLLLERVDSLPDKQVSNARHRDPNYVDTYLSSLQFLEKERQMQDLFSMEGLPPLIQGDNRLEFILKQKKTNAGWEEIEWDQRTPVYLNIEDLKLVLASVESIEIPPYFPQSNAPNLLITSFVLEKKKFFPSQDRQYRVEMQLLERNQKESL